MKRDRIWQGVRLRETEAGADPDLPPRRVTLPAAWEPEAAAALAVLAPGTGPVALPAAAEAWIRPVAEAAARAGLQLKLAERLHELLLRRRGAPDAAIWAGGTPDDALDDASNDTPGFVLNLPAFHDPETGFDLAGFAEATETATLALAYACPKARRLGVGMTDLAGLLAALGLPYAGGEARAVAACLAALLRGRADLASATLPRLSRAAVADWPAPPASCAVPGLAEAAAAAHALAPAPRHAATTAIRPPGAADALLGVETGGIAPAFSPLGADGALSRAARAWLSATGVSPEAALARLLAGDSPFAESGATARAAMRAAVAPFLGEVPDATAACPPAEAPRRRALPARRGGYTQRAALAGHKIYVRTGEYADGQLGEVSVAVQKDGAAHRGLLDAVGVAVSLGLQHGVPLESYVDAFLLTRFGQAGAVEGDPDVRQATSVLDYLARHLAASYLGRSDLPAEPVEGAPPTDIRAEAGGPDPLLPLDLPRGKTQRRLRLVER